jgi:hypothetical protein
VSDVVELAQAAAARERVIVSSAVVTVAFIVPVLLRYEASHLCSVITKSGSNRSVKSPNFGEGVLRLWAWPPFPSPLPTSRRPGGTGYGRRPSRRSRRRPRGCSSNTAPTSASPTSLGIWA